MAFNIKDEAVVAEARRMAARTGESMTEVFANAITERSARMAAEDDARRRDARVLVERCRARIAGRPMPDIGALLHDTNTGLPR